MANYTGDDLGNAFTGTDAGETIRGGAGDDVLGGGGGNDIVHGGADNDILNGDGGDDLITGGAGYDAIGGGEGDDRLDGGLDADMVYGGAGADVITDTAGSNTLHGEQGDDRITLGGSLAEGDFGTADGGAGNDLITLTGGGAEVLGGVGVDTLTITGESAFGSFGAANGIERVTFGAQLRGTDAGDSLDFSGVQVLSSAGATVSGLAGHDVLVGTGKADQLSGDAGDDVLEGAAGNDRLDGGDDADGATGVDYASYEHAAAAVSVDLRKGEAAQDTGGAGWDQLIRIEGVRGSAFGDRLKGGDAGEIFEGGAGNDRLEGNGGSDVLRGGVGADTIVGGLGMDAVLKGGVGADTFLFRSWEEMGAVFQNGLSASGYYISDTIEGVCEFIGDFSAAQGDRLDLSQIPGLTSFVGAGPFDGSAGQMRFVIGDGWTDILFDLNGGGDATLRLRLTGEMELQETAPSSRIFNALEIIHGTPERDMIEGGAHAEAIYVGEGDDFVAGRGGDDRLFGEAGQDYLMGGEGDDYIDAGEQTDTVGYGDAVRGVTVDLSIEGAQDTLGAGVDTLVNVECVSGSEFDDVLRGDGRAFNELLGGSGNDLISGGAGGTDHLVGGFGDDRLITGDVGYNLLEGGTGNDVFVITNTQTELYEREGSGHDRVETHHDWTLGDHLEDLVMLEGAVEGRGNALNNVLTGNGAANTLRGGDGNDTLDGKGGADLLQGGKGDDVYVVDQHDGVAEGADEGSDTIRADATWRLGEHFEHLVLTGSGEWSAFGNAKNNQLTGNGAANVLEGLGGHDRLKGGAGNDRLEGGEGNDQLDGEAGADAMLGGKGGDAYYVDDALDTVVEAAGEGYDAVYASVSHNLSADVEKLQFTGLAEANGVGNDLANLLNGNNARNALEGGKGGDAISGAGGDDILKGGEGDDALAGDSGDDTLDGGVGADVMSGGLGNDMYWIDDAGDRVSEAAGVGGGFDTVFSTVTHTLGADFEKLHLKGSAVADGRGNGLNNLLYGNSAANQLSGEAGNDTLLGFAGADTLSGGAGRDTLEGGEGADVLAGGLESDVFVWKTLADTGGDRVTDFARGDRLNVAALDANVAAAGDQAFSFIGGGVFTGVAGQLRATTPIDGRAEVSGDVNGDGVADFTVVVFGTTTLLAGDFVL